MRIVVRNINKNSNQTFYSQAIQANEYICKKKGGKKNESKSKREKSKLYEFRSTWNHHTFERMQGVRTEHNLWQSHEPDRDRENTPYRYDTQTAGTPYTRFSAWILNNMWFWIFNFRRSVFETDIKPADAIILHSARMFFAVSIFFYSFLLNISSNTNFRQVSLKIQKRTQKKKKEYRLFSFNFVDCLLAPDRKKRKKSNAIDRLKDSTDWLRNLKIKMLSF